MSLVYTLEVTCFFGWVFSLILTVPIYTSFYIYHLTKWHMSVHLWASQASLLSFDIFSPWFTPPFTRPKINKHLFSHLPLRFFLHARPKRHMLGVYFCASQTPGKHKIVSRGSHDPPEFLFWYKKSVMSKKKFIAARNLKDWTKFTTPNHENEKKKLLIKIGSIVFDNLCFPEDFSAHHSYHRHGLSSF